MYIYGEPDFNTMVIYHELGHVNDWESDMDLNIVEREELLCEVYKRMNSATAFTRQDKYHESFVDGTKEGLYNAAKEYWADICAEYFWNPKFCQNSYPEDFKLVDKFVKKNDPTYNVFSDRGIFDPRTGKIREGIEINDV